MLNFSIIGAIRSWFSGGPFCIRIQRKLISITDVATGRKWEDEPLVAIGRKGKKEIITAIGVEARRTGDRLVNPFDHPRILVADFFLGEKLLQHGFLMIYKRRWTPSPIVVFQVLEKLEGGLSWLEERVLREMAAGAGAREVHVWKSSELSDTQIKMGLYRSPQS